MADKSGRSFNDVAGRVRLLRALIKPDLDGPEYAKFLEVSYNRYNNVENGLPLSIDLAHAIRRKIPAVSLDYLYYGDLRGVHLDLAQRISEASEKANIGAD